jgi:hypothetical protein
MKPSPLIWNPSFQAVDQDDDEDAASRETLMNAQSSCLGESKKTGSPSASIEIMRELPPFPEQEETQRREEEQQLTEVKPVPLRALEPSATSPSAVVDLPIATTDDDWPRQQQREKQEELHISTVRQSLVPNNVVMGVF